MVNVCSFLIHLHLIHALMFKKKKKGIIEKICLKALSRIKYLRPDSDAP